MNASLIKDSWLLFSDFNVLNNNIGSTCNPSDIAHTHPLHTIHGLQSGEKGLPSAIYCPMHYKSMLILERETKHVTLQEKGYIATVVRYIVKQYQNI